MKIASYNVENLFMRAKVFNETNTVATIIANQVTELNNLFAKTEYTTADKTRMVALIIALDMLKSDTGEFAIIRKIRGKLLARTNKNTAITITANGREDWIGWVEHKLEPVNEVAIDNTGRVIKEVNADIIAVIEAENRVLLEKFSKQVLERVNGTPYKNVMLIDGNDERGIDVGVMTRDGYHFKDMRTHIFDVDARGKKIFSRDCPEYLIQTPNGEEIWILPNHYKSKYGGDDANSRNKRKAQAERTVAIYNELIAKGYDKIIVLGDLNDTPNSDPMQPLLTQTNLRDVSLHSSFDTGSYKGIGTYATGTDGNKIDYLLLSPALFNRVTASGLFRKGVWTASKRWPMFDELKKEVHGASDHHLIWCEIN